MTPPTTFFLPSRISIGHEQSVDFHPLLITSNTATELLTFAISYAKHIPRDGRLILITATHKTAFTTKISSSLFSSSSSPFANTRSIAASNRITIYYVETLAHLRVLLSNLQHSKISFLGVDSVISLHDAASELSAQGISRTIAAMVNITSASKGVLVLRESSDTVERSVTILNAGVTGSFSHSTVPIIRILGRWVRGFWNQLVNDEGECKAEWRCLGEKYQIQWTMDNGEIDDVQISNL